MLIWSQNARNPFSKGLNFKHFLGEDAPGPSYMGPAMAVHISNPLLQNPVSAPDKGPYLTIRLFALDFNEVIVDEAKGRISYHLLQNFRKTIKRSHFVDDQQPLHSNGW